jgi:hypothetical protein
MVVALLRLAPLPYFSAPYGKLSRSTMLRSEDSNVTTVVCIISAGLGDVMLLPSLPTSVLPSNVFLADVGGGWLPRGAESEAAARPADIVHCEMASSAAVV